MGIVCAKNGAMWSTTDQHGIGLYPAIDEAYLWFKRETSPSNEIHLQVMVQYLHFVVSCVCDFEVLYFNFRLSDPNEIKYWQQSYEILNPFL